MLPPKKAGGLYSSNPADALRFCRGLSVPFTVSVHGEPCTSGRRGHISFQTESQPATGACCDPFGRLLESRRGSSAQPPATTKAGPIHSGRNRAKGRTPVAIPLHLI